MDPSRVIELTDLFAIANWQEKVAWQPFQEGVEIFRLYGQGKEGPAAALLRFRPGGRVDWHEHTGFEHILVLSLTNFSDVGRETC